MGDCCSSNRLQWWYWLCGPRIRYRRNCLYRRPWRNHRSPCLYRSWSTRWNRVRWNMGWLIYTTTERRRSWYSLDYWYLWFDEPIRPWANGGDRSNDECITRVRLAISHAECRPVQSVSRSSIPFSSRRWCSRCNRYVQPNAPWPRRIRLWCCLWIYY